ncbi:MAG: helix-hairpin-helix domain-containing protein [Bacteroidales bacterium]|nr:helix-hairpin-helix domain-containing protein [Bacteroidales bacterium]
MKDSEKGRGGLQQSFLTGVIALVFLLVGYQTALLVHRAAVMKITANRDEPDTVFVYMQHDGSVQESGGGSVVRKEVRQAVRKDSQHSSRAQTVRRNVPYPAPESFRFDPNTATVEDFCRLGFTPKQAESIEAYRKKGGRFHRKSDFAKSYVVSDSVYRRLEQYIDIPLLDLNDADSAALDNLPGIGGWYASKIIEYRNSLGGYSTKEQLLEIYRFDQQKYDALKDLVTIKEPYVYPLWSLPADSLRKHPYIRNYETAKAIVMFREHNPPDAWTVEQLRSAGVISSESATLISVCAQHK